MFIQDSKKSSENLFVFLRVCLFVCLFVLAGLWGLARILLIILTLRQSLEVGIRY